MYFQDLSLRKAPEKLSQLYTQNHVSIRKEIQNYQTQKLHSTIRKVLEYVVDETLLKVCQSTSGSGELSDTNEP